MWKVIIKPPRDKNRSICGDRCTKTMQPWNEKSPARSSPVHYKEQEAEQGEQWEWREEGNALWEPHGVSQFVTWGEAIAGKSPVFVVCCHNEYLIRPRHAWQFADTFSQLQSFHQDGGCTKESTTSGHCFHPGHSYRQLNPWPLP